MIKPLCHRQNRHVSAASTCLMTIQFLAHPAFRPKMGLCHRVASVVCCLSSVQNSQEMLLLPQFLSDFISVWFVWKSSGLCINFFSLMNKMNELNEWMEWLDHYYKTKCEISGEDASTRSNSKWLLIGHYSLSDGRYFVKRGRWLVHYYKTKCELSD